MNGTPELRQAIISHIGKRTGIRYGDAEVTVSGGAKQIIYLALAATLDGDDEVIIPAPYWVSYPDMVLANDGKPVIVLCPATDGFLLTPEKARRRDRPPHPLGHAQHTGQPGRGSLLRRAAPGTGRRPDGAPPGRHPHR